MRGFSCPDDGYRNQILCLLHIEQDREDDGCMRIRDGWKFLRCHDLGTTFGAEAGPTHSADNVAGEA